ncbi:restriction endonuclease subunit S [Burkholderia ubonensis]|uniref:restriction endonuclease subunit S n=1 Tax=Burkholderia ubonensis TaxID=101571 RepID=UPI00075221DA|nr:restriction endonuclease subunit S [Burkholderia ubonensis]KWI09964.1 hypothetical protein WM01_20615 [Burkholderia ubonensis]OJA99544.1 hypothetical protein BGV51_14400 [Burkholderia ubonensis]
MAKDDKSTAMPKLRFSEFRGAWKEQELGRFLTESRIPGNDGSNAKKLTVKLWGNGVFEKVETIKGSASTQYYKRKAGQFIYSKLDFLNQAFGIIPDHLDGFESTVDLPCFDVGAGLNPQFLLEYVQRKDFYKRFGEIADGGRKAKRIQVESFLSFPIAVPERTKEQQQIADCLTSLDEVIATQGRKVEALRAHKRGLMQQLFPREGETIPRLRLPEFRDGPEWEEKALRDVCERIMDGTHFSPKTKDGPRPYLTSKNIRDGRIDLSTVSFISEDEHSEIYKRCPVRKHDVLLTKDGANTGNCAINTLDYEFSLLSSVAVLRGNSSQLTHEFLYQSIASERMQTIIQNSMSGQAITRITLEKLGLFPIMVPGISEQQRIADCLASLDARITAESEKFSAAKTHKKGLMQQLFPSLEEI